jgi:hypothetical protein
VNTGPVSGFAGPGISAVSTPAASRRRAFCREVGVMGLILLLLVVWIALSVVGFVIKGLVWLAIIGLVLFVATAAFGFLRRKSSNS